MRPPSRSGREDLARARLVNKVFRDCATPLLFRKVDVRLPHSADGSPQAWTSRLLLFSASPLVQHVEKLRVGFHRDSLRLFDSVEHYLEDDYESEEDYLLEDYLLEAAFIIPLIINACPNLRIVSIKGPRKRLYGSRFQPLEAYEVMFAKILDHVFRVLSSRTSNAPLDTIKIALPLTIDYDLFTSWRRRDLSEVGGISLSWIMQHIRHLRVKVLDGSGPGGQRYFQSRESRGHRTTPNQGSQQFFWGFIASATNLYSLNLTCSHILKFDNLALDNFTSLRELRLVRVQMSQNRFLQLIAQVAATVRAIELDHIELDSGTWESILQHMCTLPLLDHFFIDACGYTDAGPSSRYRSGLLPPSDAPQSIETRHFEDYDGLSHIQVHVNAVRAAAGLPLYTDYDYKHLRRFEDLSLE